MTPQTLFSTDIIIYQPNLNLETIQPYAKQWDMELTQMHKGSSHVTLEAVHTPRIQLGHTYYSQALLIKGAFPPKSILLFYTKTDAELTFQNSSVQKYELIISDSGDELDFLTKSQSEVFTIAIEETLFYEAFFSFFGDELKLFLQKKRFFIRPEMASTFIDGISSWISYLKTKPALLTQKNYDAVETAILKHIFSTLQIEKRLKAHAKFDIANIRNKLDSVLTSNIDMATLSHELKISKRQLYHAFKSGYGFTPKKYLQNLRLNAIRKTLLTAYPGETKVSDIAFRYQFFHMGHFAQEYKKMFDESPSQTLQRFKN